MTDETANNPVEELAPEATAPRGRTKGFVMSQDHRDKIKNSNILSRLIACGEGELELTQVQASVGLGLMKKVFPDMQSMAHSGDEDGPAIKMHHKIERLIVDPSNPNG
jgi:hypothetical protein